MTAEQFIQTYSPTVDVKRGCATCGADVTVVAPVQFLEKYGDRYAEHVYCGNYLTEILA